MLNHITLMGRLTVDPELRRTANGTAVASFSIACERDFASGTEKETDFINIVAWRNTAEFVSKYFSKGRMAVISGRLQMRSFTDKNGNKRIAAEVVTESIYFGDSKRDGAAAPSNGQTPSDVAQPAMEQQYGLVNGFTEITEDDGQLPF